ncbi:hypothetical protein LWI29_035840 [Acer saccharum]|uniref:Uncharacterized protein n=1 Tax=Acer saccharum TaxID=4024 RepID=A0AA39W1E2_ACESA|nr:hypothetical protein LWI29_035840 [Acer saccharum]
MFLTRGYNVNNGDQAHMPTGALDQKATSTSGLKDAFFNNWPGILAVLSGDLLQRNSGGLLHRRSSVGTPLSSSSFAVTICSPAALISSAARGWIWVASEFDFWWCGVGLISGGDGV